MVKDISVDFQIGRKYKPIRLVGVFGSNRVKDLMENNVEYSFYDGIIKGRISKASKEGKQITKMCNKRPANNKAVLDFIYASVLKSMDDDQIGQVLNIIATTAYDNGRREKMEEIRKALEIDET